MASVVSGYKLPYHLISMPLIAALIAGISWRKWKDLPPKSYIMHRNLSLLGAFNICHTAWIFTQWAACNEAHRRVLEVGMRGDGEGIQLTIIVLATRDTIIITVQSKNER